MKLITPTLDGRKQYAQTFVTSGLGNGKNKKTSKAYKPERRGYRKPY